MATQKPHTPVIIIGAGFSGLITACQLQRKLNLTDYTIYERSNDYGGTWSANTCKCSKSINLPISAHLNSHAQRADPGCGVDIPAILYSISFLPNPSFSQLFPERAEILSYIRSVAKKFDLERHVRLNTGWEGATWQEDSKRWLVRLRDVKTGEKFEQECSVLLSCVGGLVNPQPCALNGVEDFKGRILHTAKWDEGVEWKGEDVVVVGNGCAYPSKTRKPKF
jgi:cation diffusion facilitator CzcD-associated flavoprotein CzcO